MCKGPLLQPCADERNEYSFARLHALFWLCKPSKDKERDLVLLVHWSDRRRAGKLLSVLV